VINSKNNTKTMAQQIQQKDIVNKQDYLDGDEYLHVLMVLYTHSTVLLITLISSSSFPLIFGQEFFKTRPCFFLRLGASQIFLEAPVRPTWYTGQTGLEPIRSSWEPVRPVDALSVFFVLPCPQTLKSSLKPWGSPPEATSRQAFAPQ
jgi:hypothetical protein